MARPRSGSAGCPHLSRALFHSPPLPRVDPPTVTPELPPPREQRPNGSPVGLPSWARTKPPTTSPMFPATTPPSTTLSRSKLPTPTTSPPLAVAHRAPTWQVAAFQLRWGASPLLPRVAPPLHTLAQGESEPTPAHGAPQLAGSPAVTTPPERAVPPYPGAPASQAASAPPPPPPPPTPGPEAAEEQPRPRAPPTPPRTPPSPGAVPPGPAGTADVPSSRPPPPF